MGKELLFEIGTEEIPSGYLPPALEDLRTVASRLLAEQRLTCAELRTLGTPRRLTLFVDGLIDRPADISRLWGFSAGGRLIFNLGHGIQPETPIAHVEQMLKRVRAYNG